jgi:hypothetical protein
MVGAVELAAETSADLLGSGVRGGAGATAIWKPSESVSTETGLSLQTQFGQRATPAPYLRWKWRAAKNLELELRSIGLQNGVVGTWFITDDKASSLRASLFYETAQYALRAGAPADGVMIGEVPLRLTFTQFLNRSCFVSLRGQLTLIHRESFYRNNDKVGGFNTGVAPGFGLMVGLLL